MKLSQTVEDFCRWIESLPGDRLEDQAWGPKEVLAHLLYYHELYVQEIEAAVKGLPFEPPVGRYSDLNARAVAASRDTPASELAQRLRAADARLRQLYQACDPSQVAIQIKGGVKPRTLDWLIPEVEAHVRRHHQTLQKGSGAFAG